MVDIELLKKGVEEDLTKLRSVIRHNFPYVRSRCKDFHDSSLDTSSALGVYRFCPGVLGCEANTCHDSNVTLRAVTREAYAVNGDPGPRRVGWTVMFGRKRMLFQGTKLTNITSMHILMNRGPHVPPVNSGSQGVVRASRTRVLKLKVNAAYKS